MRINANISALNTHRQLSINNASTARSLERLSSGLRINRAGDDAAGLAISEKMRSQVRGLHQASRNAQDGISLIQTAEGALTETHSILQRMRELAVQAATDTNTTDDRARIQQEIVQLRGEITRIGSTTQFNTKNLIDGAMAAATAGTLAVADVHTTGGLSSLTTAGTPLVDLLNASGVNIGLAVGDIISVNWTVGGIPRTATHTIVTGNTMATLLATINAVPTPGVGATLSGGNIRLTAVTAGLAGRITGLSIGVTTAGNVPKGAPTAALNSFAQTTVAADEVPATPAGAPATFHIGSNMNQNITLAIGDMRATALGVGALDVTTQVFANAAITTVDTAIGRVSAERGMLGAVQNRLEHTIDNLGTSAENLAAAESRIRDVDMAQEMMEFTRNNILAQAAQAMLAQANQQPQGVLQLLR